MKIEKISCYAQNSVSFSSSKKKPKSSSETDKEAALLSLAAATMLATTILACNGCQATGKNNYSPYNDYYQTERALPPSRPMRQDNEPEYGYRHNQPVLDNDNAPASSETEPANPQEGDIIILEDVEQTPEDKK